MVIALDSIAGDFLKPTMHMALNKMGSVLEAIDA